MDLFDAVLGLREDKKPPPSNLSSISYRDDIWHSYTLLKEDAKNI